MTWSQYFYLPVNFQPSEGMAVGHSELFTAKFSANFQPSEAITVGHSELVPLNFSAKQGDDMVTVFVFTAKFSAKRRDASRSQ